MVCAAPAAAGAPVLPSRDRDRRRTAEGTQGHVFQGHDDEREGAATVTTTAGNSRDSFPSANHLYHRLITYPLDEIKLPPAQVGGAADRCC